MTNSIQFKSIQFNKYMQNIFCKTPDGIAISWLIRQSPHVVYAPPFCEIPTESPPADSFVIGITMYMHNHFAKHPTESLSADSFIIGITEIVTGRMAFSTAGTLLNLSIAISWSIHSSSTSRCICKIILRNTPDGIAISRFIHHRTASPKSHPDGWHSRLLILYWINQVAVIAIALIVLPWSSNWN